MQEEIKERNDRVERIRLSLLAHDPSNISVLFPDLFPVTVAETEREIDNALAGDGPTEFQTSMSVEDIDFVLKSLGMSGSLNNEEFGG